MRARDSREIEREPRCEPTSSQEQSRGEEEVSVIMNTVDVSVQTNLTFCTQLFTEESFSVNGKDYVKFYTGLTDFDVLKTVFDIVAPPVLYKTKLTQFQEFLLTLIKLRLDLPYKDLAYRFGLSLTTVSRIFF